MIKKAWKTKTLNTFIIKIISSLIQCFDLTVNLTLYLATNHSISVLGQMCTLSGNNSCTEYVNLNFKTIFDYFFNSIPLVWITLVR